MENTKLKDRALALYAPPFRYEMGYIHDSKHKMVADDALPEPEHLEPGMALRVRGWGHIQKHEDPAELQDEVGRQIAQALTKHWEPRKSGVPLNWKQRHGRLVEALMGPDYAHSARNRETDQVIGDAIESGKSLGEVIDICAGLAESTEELVAMVWALGIYHGARGGNQL
jgi:hypothetical protein